MPKGWLCDRGESGSERKAKPPRHVVNELARRLYACVFLFLLHHTSVIHMTHLDSIKLPNLEEPLIYFD
jgi:hypothetical protein